MKQRPILTISMTFSEKVIKVLSILLIGGQFIYLFYLYKSLPEKVPVHFNAMGKADGWGGKGFIWTIPIIESLLFITLSIVERYPHVNNYPVRITEENAPRLYFEARRMMVTLNFEIVLLLSLITWESVQVAKGIDSNAGWFLPVFLLIIFGTVGITVYRLVRMK
ncbi:DUF1648 domain-containing protein [Neobacillus sp. LXY-1]|uniref:DUF1648 domain-containing protein n=1 Tax=Neobacillus sp. LXY-1 TaxID=3379133 RepID=UPI003EE36DDB